MQNDNGGHVDGPCGRRCEDRLISNLNWINGSISTETCHPLEKSEKLEQNFQGQAKSRHEKSFEVHTTINRWDKQITYEYAK